MVFNSPEFVLFLPIVFFLYWFAFSKSAKSQNIILLFSSIFFYAWADWGFLFLVIANVLFNFFIGIQIQDTQKEKHKQQLIWLGVCINLGILGYFKYFNFFYDSFVDLINLSGTNLNYSSLKILLPLGISFFTFQTLGYLFDIYNEEIEPCRDILVFSTYVLYFPKILAGPIERAQKFIPQIEVNRVFNNNLAFDGLRQILWGLFAKIVIADNCAGLVNEIFANSETQAGSMLMIGSIFFLIQIYCDFSGYSNIAIGVSKLLGIKLMTNFATPFFSTNISDFWKKWHISLTSWLMDYVFTPLSFLLRKNKKTGLFIAILITFILVGFWHGANWTYIIFGILQGFYFLPMIIRGTLNKSSVIAPGKALPSLKEFLQMSFLFILLALTSVLFRAESVSQAFTYLSNIFSASLFQPPDLKKFAFIAPVMLLFMIIEWFSRNKQHPLEFNNRSVYFKWAIYLILGFVVLLAYDNNPNDFIYLQF
jgi:D-alanyl-lipoteichoic acid acyltransferase DltB (MBOAT superfamily)